MLINAYVCSAVVMGENIYVIIIVLSHAVGSPLAHTHAVSVSGSPERNLRIGAADGKVSGTKAEKIPDLASVHNLAAYLDGIYPPSFAAGEYFDIVFIDVDCSVSVFHFRGKLRKGEGDGFTLVGSFLLVFAFHASQVGQCGNKDIFRIFRFSAAGGVKERLFYKLAVVIENLSRSLFDCRLDFRPPCPEPFFRFQIF